MSDYFNTFRHRGVSKEPRHLVSTSENKRLANFEELTRTSSTPIDRETNSEGAPLSVDMNIITRLANIYIYIYLVRGKIRLLKSRTTPIRQKHAVRNPGDYKQISVSHGFSGYRSPSSELADKGFFIRALNDRLAARVGPCPTL